MRIFILFLLVLLFGACTYLWVNGKELHEVRTEIDIVAAPGEVWVVLADINNWHQWNPIINDSSGNVSLGETLAITMAGAKEYQKGPVYNPIITGLEKPSYFHWRAEMMTSFIMTNDKIIELQAAPMGTRLVHRETFKGMAVPMLRGTFDRNVPTMLNAMNQALKKKAEKIE
ncbi:MAG: SRPBCC family protein [Gammaproteobacteria bacterium]